MSTTVWDEAAYRRFVQTEVAPMLLAKGRRVESQAKVNATGGPVPGARNPEGRGPRVRTGRLRSSITTVPGSNDLGPYVDIGTNVFYGRILEVEGTRAGTFYPFLGPALAMAKI